MACGSGCCGPPQEPAPATGQSIQTEGTSTATAAAQNADAGVNEVKASDASTATASGACCSTDSKTLEANNGCCSAPPEAGAVQDNCCSPVAAKQPNEPADACNDGCCSSEAIDAPNETIQRGDECCSTSIAANTMQDECCSPAAPKETAQSDKAAGGCCSSSDARTGDACCSTEATVDDDKELDGCFSPDDSTPTIKDDCCPSEAAKPAPTKADDGCCSSNTNAALDACCSPKTAAATIQKTDGCCSGTTRSAKTDACCAPSKIDEASKPDVDASEGDRPSCCKGKSYPCCDETCLDVIALRECHSTSSSSNGKCGKGTPGRPCSEHAKSARYKYRSRLEALGCICRALVALGQDSCCTKPAGARRAGSVRSRTSASVKSRGSAASCKDSCCDEKAPVKPKPKTKTKPSAASDTASGCNAGCCATSKPQVISRGSCSDDSCCREEIISSTIPGKPKPLSSVTHEKAAGSDLETKGASGKEHVVLAISGMTCTGCETKLQRTLGTLDSLANLKTSLVLARVEFDLDLGQSTVEQVMKHIERTTEFKCEQVNARSSYLDLIAHQDAQALVNGHWPLGVTDMKVIDGGKAVRVEFDSQLIGARDLAERGWNQPMELAAPKGDAGLEAGSKHVRSMGYMTLLSAVLTIPVLVMAWAPLPEAELEYASASLALATLVQFVVAGPFYPKALKSLIFSKVIEMDLLIVLSTSAAYIFSVVSFGYLVRGQPLSIGEFFETSTLLVTLIMVGRYVAALARQKAVESISIRSLQTTTAVLVDEDGTEKTIDTRLLQFGDVFKVAPESKVPTDGTVISGSSEIDESMLTGESIPIEKHKGSIVIAGSVNGTGVLQVRLTRLPEHNTISTIASMVDEAKLSKPKIQEIADRVATYFVPVIIGLTVLTFVIWLAVGIKVRGYSAQESTIQAITYAITVLIVSCPCAIGLAVPMVIVISSGMAAERGIVFKSSHAIEIAYKAKHVVFDKTGTLTSGKLTVSEELCLGEDPMASKSLLLGLVSQSKHPVSVAISRQLESAGCKRSDISNVKTVAGKGVEGTLDGKILRAGNSRWLKCFEEDSVQGLLGKGYTVFGFTIDDSLVAVFGLEDTLKEDASSTIKELQAKEIQVHVLSGDDDGAVRSITSRLGIPDENVRSRCAPGDKQMYVRDLANPAPTAPKQKSDKPVVLFCGDGTNDAVALAEATIGVHMNGGTDVAQSAADTVLVRPDLSKILTIMNISRKSIHRIAFNFAWSFVYNVLAILLASGALVNARIPPEYAGLGELVSVLPVIIAAALLRWTKIE